MINKKIAIAFLAVINIINIAAGIITQVNIFTGKDVNSIIPIASFMNINTVNQILLINFMCVAAILVLISIVTTYLTTDIPYSPAEILKNCPGPFLLIPAALLVFSFVNAFRAEIGTDKIVILLCGVLYFICNVVHFGCIITVKEDSEE